MAKKTYKKRVYDDYRKYASKMRKKGIKPIDYSLYKKQRRGYDKTIVESYEAYKRNRQKLIEKGHTMDVQMSLPEYVDAHLKAKDIGTKNIARTLAQEEQTYKTKFARKLIKKLKSIDLDEIAMEKPWLYNELVYLKDKYQTVEDVIGVGNRKQLFTDITGITKNSLEGNEIFGREYFIRPDEKDYDKDVSWY